MSALVLSLFPGIGLLDMAFEEEGFCVVRGPDLLWGGDIHRFHPPAGRFEGVIGGPPCTSFSKLGVMARRRGQQVGGDLVPEFERCVAEACPSWFVMENVPEAPLPAVDGWLVQAELLDNRLDAGGVQRRRRRFSFGTRDGRALPLDWWRPPVPVECIPTVTANGAEWIPSKRKSMANRSEAYLRKAIRAQGLPEDFDLPPFTLAGKVKAIGNGVPLPMGRAIAKAVKAALASGVAA
jgi:DNA (cytosine-5)-methyltransferase 1